MSDNPFSGPDESERTVIRRGLGNRQPPVSPPTPSPPAEESERTVIRPPPAGGPPVMPAAVPILDPDEGERTVIRPAPGGRRPAGAPPAPVPEFDEGERTIFRPAPGARQPAAMPPVPGPVSDQADRTVFRPTPGGRRPAAAPDMGEGERTVIRPAPGGRRSAPGPAFAEAAPAVAPAAAPIIEDVEAVAASKTPLVAAAAPLLQLLARLRNTARQPDAGELRERAAGAMQSFETKAREAGVPPELLRPAHYALCASIDDVVVNTPWGARSGWAARSLVATFHADIGNSERFFDMLARLRADPAKFLPLLELIYLCLSLGFMGRYRHTPNGDAELDQLREETFALVASQRRTIQPQLSPRWVGVSAPYRPARAHVPLWVVAAVTLAVCGGLFAWVSTGLNGQSDDDYARVLAAAPAHMPQITRAAPVQPPPPAPPPPEPTILDRLQGALKPEIDKGFVTVLGTASSPVLRIGDRGLFPAASATLQQSAVPLLERIGTVLKGEAGSVRVIGYTDNQPIRTVKFPSNFQLSTARAEAIRSVVGHSIGDAGRVSAEGRADEDPVASNTTAEGREQNRRIEIVLQRPETGP